MIPLVVAMVVVLLMMAGAVIDIGNAYRVKRALQASADAAATAGADDLPDPVLAVASAHRYGSENSGLNPIHGVSGVQLSADANCNTGPQFCAPANTVSVTERVTIDTYFLKIIGIDQIPIKVTAQACSPCGSVPLDIVMVLDRTGSMTGAKLTNAKLGVEAFLGSLDPTSDNVSLAVLPPAASLDARCDPGNTNSYDDPGAPYVVVPLSDDYQNPDGSLNASSDLVSTLRCTQPGGGTAYAHALDAARDELDAHGRPGVQKVIILLSDGAANNGPRFYPPSSAYRTQPCHEAIAIADADRAANVLMYSIAYDAGGELCKTESGANENPQITAEQALEQIANPGNYYNQPDPASLRGIFLAISADMQHGTSRLNG